MRLIAIARLQRQRGPRTGKSTRIRQDLLALADREEISSGELLLLVPEQFSYETERAYYHALGIRRADRVQVLSFKRLSDEVLDMIRASLEARRV